MEVVLTSLESTRRLAASICQAGSAPFTIALNGTLGTGKTQFVRYFATSMGVAAEDVTSPTYVLLQRYRGEELIYHFDFYRLESADQVWDLGIDEIYELPVWILIEWANKFPECLPEDVLRIELGQQETGERSASLSACGPRSQAVLDTIQGLSF